MILLPELYSDMGLSCNDLTLEQDISFFNADDFDDSDWVEVNLKVNEVIVHDSSDSITKLTKSKFVNG